MFLQAVLLIKVLLVHLTTQTQVEDVVADCRENVTLQCLGLDSMDFLSVTWYKVSKSTSTGILMWDKGENKTMPYPFTRPAQFGHMYGLFLSSVAPEDSALYECEISAVLGDKNQHPRVNLTVTACAAQAEPTATTTAATLNSTQRPRHQRQEDLPALWSVSCITAVALLKVILSAMAISIFRAVCKRCSRQRQLHW